MPQQLVVVFDTSVLIPLILPASRSTGLFRRLREAGHRVALTEPIYEELEENLRTNERLRAWMRRSDEEIGQFLTDLRTTCYLLPGCSQAHGAVKADAKDDKIIAAALEAEASYIVAEDKHLLELQTYQGIQIMNRADFAAELDGLGKCPASLLLHAHLGSAVVVHTTSVAVMRPFEVAQLTSTSGLLAPSRVNALTTPCIAARAGRRRLLRGSGRESRRATFLGDLGRIGASMDFPFYLSYAKK